MPSCFPWFNLVLLTIPQVGRVVAPQFISDKREQVLGMVKQLSLRSQLEHCLNCVSETWVLVQGPASFFSPSNTRGSG